MRWFNVVVLLLLTACTQTRVITFDSKPPDAMISIDNQPAKRAGFTQEIKFKNAKETHVVTASRSGYKDQSKTLALTDKATEVLLELKPVTRRVNFSVSPVPAVISIDDATVSTEPMEQYSADLEFYKDAKDNWTPHTIRAARPGFLPAEISINYTDAVADYTLALAPMHKDVLITTTPPGALVTIDGQSVGGVTPVTAAAVEFPYNTSTNSYTSRKVVVTKPGYDPSERMISWDGGQLEYRIDIQPKHKDVHFITDPSGAIVTINGHILPVNDLGQPTARITFPPLDDKGTLPVYSAIITKKTTATEWYPVTMTIDWDGGRTEYSATLNEIKTRDVPLTEITVVRNSDGIWEVKPRETETVGEKDPGEPGRESPVRVYTPEGASIGTISVAPDGDHILFTLITGHKEDCRSKIMTVATDGAGGTQQLTEGKALDAMPSYTPAGDSIVFCSNRGSKRLDIWEKPINGDGGLTQLTHSFEEVDIWPMIDAAPKQRLFYEALIDSQPTPLLYMTVVGTTIRSDLTKIPVSQPRISPKADAVIFTSVNEKTGNREIYKTTDRGGLPINLSNDPEVDCYDPAWSLDGNMIAYASDRGMDANKHRNADIWLLDLTHPEKPTQITTNGSVDDCPAWDPNGSFIYFRSNRGGTWGIWKIAVSTK